MNPISPQWVIVKDYDETPRLYEVEYAGNRRIIVKNGDSSFRAFKYDQIRYVSDEEAMIFKLEN